MTEIAMLETIVKICGCKTEQAVIAARDGGASHLGFIFFEKSPRYVQPSQAARLAQLAGKCETVAVSVNADDKTLDEIFAAMNPAIMQLHGNESPERVRQVADRFGVPIVKALGIREKKDMDEIFLYDGIPQVKAILLDCKGKNGLYGGTGKRFDWSMPQGVLSEKPLWLAGGIDIDNVKEALELIAKDDNRLHGIDVSSGVESAAGVKDIDKIKNLLQCVQDAISGKADSQK